MMGLLMIAAGSSFAAAQPDLRGLAPGSVATIAKERVLDLRLSEELGSRRRLTFSPGMILRRDVAPNAAIGLGIASMYGKEGRRRFACRRPPQPLAPACRHLPIEVLISSKPLTSC